MLHASNIHQWDKLFLSTFHAKYSCDISRAWRWNEIIENVQTVNNDYIHYLKRRREKRRKGINFLSFKWKLRILNLSARLSTFISTSFSLPLLSLPLSHFKSSHSFFSSSLRSSHLIPSFYTGINGAWEYSASEIKISMSKQWKLQLAFPCSFKWYRM